ncbi:hypothetical protein L3Q82_023539 [Scortum barcoo]|uniref:Uncharacterized protein n=1 Tax=Scortum barcoo TaxID=214431 RepID=A0ACB8WTX7_9TELE|nr:hypothetical protein L3Q82_023539 [Scortum barcoo]
MAAELGSYKQAHTSLAAAHPGQLQSSGGSSPSQGAGFQSPSYAWRDWVRRGPPPRLLPKPHCTGPSWTFLRVVSLLEGGPTSPFRAEPGRVPWAKTRPPGARLRAPTPGLAPGWGPGNASPPSATGCWISSAKRPQAVRVGNNISSSITLSTGAPQGCVLSPLLFTLLTHDCTPTHSSIHLVKFADDTTLVGLITKGDETHYRKEVQLLTRWCKDNNLLLNVSKTKEIVVSFQRGHTQHHPLTIDGAAVERVSSTTKFLGVHISDDLSWTTNTESLAKKAQQRLYFLRKLKRASAPPPIMTTFYRGTIESILTTCITVWGGSYTVHNRKALQRIVRTAERIIGVPLPSLQDLYTTRLTRKAITIVNDASHPAHSLFSLLPSGKRYRSLRSRTTRLTNSFIHQAVRLLNSLPSPLPAPARRSTRLGGGV